MIENSEHLTDFQKAARQYGEAFINSLQPTSRKKFEQVSKEYETEMEKIEQKFDAQNPGNEIMSLSFDGIVLE